MPVKKLNKAYVGILVLVLLMTVYHVYTLIAIQDIASNRGPEPPSWFLPVFRRLLIQFAFIFVVLSVEGVFYYINRKVPVKRLWVRSHIVLLYFTLIGTPILLYLFSDFYVVLFGSGNEREDRALILTLKNMIMLLLAVMAHVFFLLVVLQVISYKKNIQKESDMEHLLGETLK